MSYIKSILSKVRPEEWLALFFFILISFINIFVYEQQIGLKHSIFFMFKYHLFGTPFYGLFFLVIFSLSVGIFYRQMYGIIYKWSKENQFPDKVTFFNLISKVTENIRYVFPVLLILIASSQLLSNISFESRFAPKDFFLARLDYAVTGRLLFVDLPTYFDSETVNTLMYRLYKSLSFVVSPFLILLLFLKNNYLLRLALTSVAFSFLFAYPVYYFVPSPGPDYSLLKNVRNIAIPEDVKGMLSGYNPSQTTINTTNEILAYYTDESKDNAGLASSFPSMHAIWGLIIVYFLYKIKKYTLLISIPWTVLMLTGGLYFGQHYFVDYLASIPVAILCICSSYYLINKHVDK